MSWYSDVLEVVFPDLDREHANKSRTVKDEKSDHADGDKNE